MTAQQRRFKLPAAQIIVHFQKKATKIVMRKTGGTVAFDAESVSAFIDRYKAAGKDFTCLYSGFVDYTDCDDYIAKMGNFDFGDDKQLSEFKSIFEQFKNAGSVWLSLLPRQDPPRRKSARGRPASVTTSTSMSSTTDTTITSTSDTTGSIDTLSLSPVSASPARFSARNFSKLCSMLSEMKATSEPHFAHTCLMQEQVNGMTAIIKQQHCDLTELRKSLRVIQTPSPAPKKPRTGPYKEFDECSQSHQRRRIKLAVDVKKTQIGDSKAGNEKYLCREFRQPAFQEMLLDCDKVMYFLENERSKVHAIKAHSIGNIYHEIFIMIKSQISGRVYDEMRFEREYTREYVYVSETNSYKLSRPKQNHDIQPMEVQAKDIAAVMSYIYRLDPVNRGPLVPHAYTKKLSDNRLAYIKYVDIKPLISYMLHVMHTHYAYVGNTSLYHAHELVDFLSKIAAADKVEGKERSEADVDDDAAAADKVEGKERSEADVDDDDECKTEVKVECVRGVQKYPPKDKYTVDERSVVISGEPILFAFKYDAKAKPKFLPKKSALTHGELAPMNILRRGLIHSPSTHRLATLTNLHDDCADWVEWIVSYVGDFDCVTFDTIIPSKVIEKKVITRHEVILFLAADLCAMSTANGAKKNAQQWLCILTPCAGDQASILTGGSVLHTYQGDKIELERKKGMEREFRRLPKIPYDEYQKKKKEGKKMPARFVTEIPGGYRRQVDVEYDRLYAEHKADGILETDEEIKQAIAVYFEGQFLIYNAKAIPLMYRDVLFCALHTKLAGVKHQIIISTVESLNVWRVAKEDLDAVIDAMKKYEPSLAGQLETLRTKITDNKKGLTFQLSMDGDIAARYLMCLPIYHKLFVLHVATYKGDGNWIASMAMNHLISYFLSCFMRVCDIATIDTSSDAFLYIFDALITFGCDLSDSIERVFPQKLGGDRRNKKVYLDLILRIFPFKLKCLLMKYKVGAICFSNQGCEHVGKVIADQAEFTQRHQIRPVSDDDDDEDSDDDGDDDVILPDNYLDQIWRRRKILAFGLEDFNRLQFNVIDGVKRDAELADRVSKQSQQILEFKKEMEKIKRKKNQKQRVLKLHELSFFSDITDLYFDSLDGVDGDIRSFNEFLIIFRDLKICDTLSTDINVIKSKYSKLSEEAKASKKRKAENTEIAFVEPPTNNKKRKSGRSRGKKIQDNNDNDEN